MGGHKKVHFQAMVRPRLLHFIVFVTYCTFGVNKNKARYLRKQCNGLDDFLGGDKGDRTPDLMTASHALSQLSYIPKALEVQEEFIYLLLKAL